MTGRQYFRVDFREAFRTPGSQWCQCLSTFSFDFPGLLFLPLWRCRGGWLVFQSATGRTIPFRLAPGAEHSPLNTAAQQLGTARRLSEATEDVGPKGCKKSYSACLSPALNANPLSASSRSPIARSAGASGKSGTEEASLRSWLELALDPLTKVRPRKGRPKMELWTVTALEGLGSELQQASICNFLDCCKVQRSFR